MNDYRAAGQELQSQVMAAARKGQERVHSTVKTVTGRRRPDQAAASQPAQAQPVPPSSLPSQAQLRERAPQLVTKLPTRLQTRLPKPDQLRASAEEFAGHARIGPAHRRSARSRSVAAPLAQQAATASRQISEPVDEQGEHRESSTGTGRQAEHSEQAEPVSKDAGAPYHDQGQQGDRDRRLQARARHEEQQLGQAQGQAGADQVSRPAHRQARPRS